MKALKNWRYYLLITIALVCVVSALGVPSTESKSFFEILIISKLIAIATGGLFAALLSYFLYNDKLPEFNSFLEDE